MHPDRILTRGCVSTPTALVSESLNDRLPDLSRVESTMAQANERMNAMSFNMAEMSRNLRCKSSILLLYSMFQTRWVSAHFNLLSSVHNMAFALSEESRARRGTYLEGYFLHLENT